MQASIVNGWQAKCLDAVGLRRWMADISQNTRPRRPCGTRDDDRCGARACERGGDAV